MYHRTHPAIRVIRSSLLLFGILLFLFAESMNAQVDRIEPPNWWIGMKNPQVNLMLHGKKLGKYRAETDYPGVRVLSSDLADSPNYLFVRLEIDPEAQPGEVEIRLLPERGRSRRFVFPLYRRERQAETYRGFDSSDAIYLITPDRFANGDPSNDFFKDLRENRIDRKDDYGRHGGDIRGIIEHLEYIHGLGFTAIWPTPLLINDMKRSSYHGYAITDYYRVDPRFGTLQEYRELADKARELGIKLIMDQVANHMGSGHWWMEDLPFEDWLNFQERFEDREQVPNSNHRRTVNQDPYAAQVDELGMSQGWFVPAMPDLNQRNPYLAEYIIQNSIWWIETLGLGGIRQDTYPYPDKHFMAEWAGRIMEEYPRFNITGEEWSYNPLLVGYWQDGAKNAAGYRSHLKTPMDFPMQKAISEGLKEEESWDKGLVKIYEGLANDFHYVDPLSLLLFGDNHDMRRLHTHFERDEGKTRQALALIACLPRIPQLYYGTEALVSEDLKKPGDHGLVRSELTGGWTDHQKSVFTGEGLSDSEIGMLEFTRRLFNFRKQSEVIHKGKTIHFAPRQGVYVLCRYLGERMVVLAINKNNEPSRLDLRGTYRELSLERRSAEDVFSGERFELGETLEVPANGLRVISL